jgi:hypothetical protein
MKNKNVQERVGKGNADAYITSIVGGNAAS